MTNKRRTAGALLVWLALALGSPAAAQNGALYFVQLTDTHLGVMDHETVLGQMVEAINKLPFPIACVVHTGDLVMDNFDKPSVQASATSILGRIRAPVHVVAGNHDLSEKSTAPTVAAWTKRFGPLGATAEYNGVLFVFVFTEGQFKEGPVGEFNAYGFLDRTLEKAGGRPVLLFQHSAWFEDFYGNALHPGWPGKMRARWVERVKSGPVKAVITGHCHRDELHWEGEVPVYVGEAAARFWGRQPAFRVYCWKDGRLSYRTWYLNDAK
ncbi:MAG: metallophosphoesterase [Kiritimatiellia bacterium]